MDDGAVEGTGGCDELLACVEEAGHVLNLAFAESPGGEVEVVVDEGGADDYVHDIEAGVDASCHSCGDDAVGAVGADEFGCAYCRIDLTDAALTQHDGCGTYGSNCVCELVAFCVAILEERCYLIVLLLHCCEDSKSHKSEEYKTQKLKNLKTQELKNLKTQNRAEHGLEAIPDGVGSHEGQALGIGETTVELLLIGHEVVGTDAGEAVAFVGEPDGFLDVGREDGEGGDVERLGYVARSAFVAEEEIAIGGEGAEVRQRGCLDGGEDMGVVAEFLLIAECYIAFLACEIEDDLCVEGMDDATEDIFHGLGREDFVFESCGGCGDDDGAREVDASLLHELAVALTVLVADIEAELLGESEVGDFAKRTHKEVVLLDAVAGSLGVVVNAV